MQRMLIRCACGLGGGVCWVGGGEVGVGWGGWGGGGMGGGGDQARGHTSLSCTCR